MAQDLNSPLAGIIKPEVFTEDARISECYNNLADNKERAAAEDKAHNLVLGDISVRFGEYFRFLNILSKPGSGNPNLAQVKVGKNITLENLVSFGLSSEENPNEYDPTTVADLLKGIDSEIDTKKNSYQALAETNMGLGTIIKKINELAIHGARKLGKFQEGENGTAGFNLDFRDVTSALGLPVGFGLQDGGTEGGDRKLIDAVSSFYDKRIDLARNRLADESSKQDFMSLLIDKISKFPASTTGFFQFLSSPTSSKPPYFLKVGANLKVRIKTGDDNEQQINTTLAKLLSAGTEAQSAAGFTLQDVSNTVREFVKSLVDKRLVINNGGDSKIYRELFIERYLPECRERNKSGSPDVEIDETFPIIGSTLELKRKRLQNIRCVMPMFEDLYSSTSPVGIADDGVTGVYSKSYKHTLGSQNSTRAAAKNKFFTDEHHPLIFAYTKDSHFFINKLFNRGKGRSSLKTFLEATNTDISFLQPRIRVYKVLETQEGKEQEIPIEFSNKIELTRSSGVYERENAGIERVRMRRTGQTPATFDKLIDVNIRFIFDSINAFTKCRTTSIGKKKYSYVDLLRRPVELKKTDEQIGKIKSTAERFFPKGTSGDSDIDKFIDDTQEISLDSYNPDKFQIKLEIGWSFNEQVFQSQSLSKKQKLKEFIDDNNLVLYLTLMTHDFTFRNDGTVSLDARYMGRTGGQLIDAFQTNIFHTPKLGRIHKSLNVVDDIISYDSKTKNKKLNINRTYLQNQKNKLINMLESERSELTSQIWKRLVDASLSGKEEVNSNESVLISDASGNSHPTHLLKLTMPRYFAFFDTDSLEKFGVKASKSEREHAEGTSGVRVTSTPTLLSYYRNIFLEGKAKPDENLKLEVVAKVDNLKAKGDTTDRSGDTAEADLKNDPLRPEDFEDQLDNNKFDPDKFPYTYMSQDATSASVEMYCLRYGSIIHSAIQNIWQFNPDGLKDIVIMLASTRFESISGNNVRHFNFADVPILFEDWKKFMIDKVVDKKRVNYAFIDFLRDSMMELLIPAMGAINTGCKDGTQIASPLKAVKPRLTSFSARRQKGLKPSDGRISVSLDKKQAALLAGNSLLGNDSIVDGDPHLKHFLVIYDAGFSAPATLEKGRKPKLYDTNLKNNIPHVFIGANRGIMRSISFRKNTVPYLQESKVLDRGDTDYGLFREKYDVTLETIGNPHFHQGMRFYLDPTFTGMSSHNVDVVQGVLGLGGYYDIVDVTSDISNSGFKTNIVGSWQAFHEGYDSKKRHIDPCKDK